MKKISLKVIHRLLLQGVLNEEGKAGHTLSQLNKMLKVTDKLAFTEEELKAINLRIVDTDDNGNKLQDTQYKWNSKDADGNDLDAGKEIELSDEQNQLIKDLFKKKNDAKEFKLGDVKPMLEIAAEIGFDVE